MSLEKSYKNISDSLKIIKMTILIAFFMNLSTLHEWLNGKEASASIAPFLKLTQALNDIGNEFYLNSIRNSIRNQVLMVNKTSLKYPIVPDSHVPRQLAAVDPVLDPLISDEDMSDLDFIDQILDDNDYEQPKKGVLVLGDSILKSGLQEHIERNLATRFKGISIEVKSKSGTGLSRPDVFDWVKYVDETKMSFEKVIIFLGTNDAQNLVVDKKVIVFDSTEWRAEYALRVRALIQNICSKASQVYWVSSLRMKSDVFDAKMKSLNSVVKQEIKSNPSCAQFISVNNWFTKKAKYTDTWTIDSKKTGKKTIKFRVADGIHLTYWGADLFSQKLIESIYE